jgi:hypothetical protein
MADSEKASSRRRKEIESGKKPSTDSGKSGESDNSDPLSNLPGMNN